MKEKKNIINEFLKINKIFPKLIKKHSFQF